MGRGSHGWSYLIDGSDVGFAALDLAYASKGWLDLGWAGYGQANGETWPAVCDLDGDGAGEVVFGLGRRSGGYMRAFDSATGMAPLQGTPRPDGWFLSSWDSYNLTSGETHPSCGDLDADGLDELLIGLGTGGLGWLELLDDLDEGLGNMDWWQLDWSGYNGKNGSTRPAISK